jgi:hypothetical protein
VTCTASLYFLWEASTCSGDVLYTMSVAHGLMMCHNSLQYITHGRCSLAQLCVCVYDPLVSYSCHLVRSSSQQIVCCVLMHQLLMAVPAAWVKLKSSR